MTANRAYRIAAAAIAAVMAAGAEERPLAGIAAEAQVRRVGAVDWDCSLPSSTFFGRHATRSLGPEKFRDRTPYYAQPVGKDKIDYADRTLAEYEREMRHAIDAGLDYLAYCWYDQVPQPAPDPSAASAPADPHVHELVRARLLHARSPLRDRLHLCAIIVTCHAYSDHELTALAREMRNPWYEKVGGRPLTYLFQGVGPIERLRGICRREGAGDPYAVLMGDGVFRRLPPKNRAQVQALCAYAFTGDGKDFAAFTAKAVAANTARAQLGLPVIPHLATGWDPTPRIEHPVPWVRYARNHSYQFARTAADFRLMANETKKWIEANAERCPTGHVLAFAWNEFEEGGWICPVLGSDGQPDTSRCGHFAEAVRILKGR